MPTARSARSPTTGRIASRTRTSPRGPSVASSGWNIEWNEALSVGIGALVLVLALGLGLGYLRRPKLALSSLDRWGQRRKRALRSPLFVVRRFLGLARVEPQLEEGAQLLARREHVFVARTPRRQLHDPHVVVAHAVAARIGSGLVELASGRSGGCERTWEGHSRDLSATKGGGPQFAGNAL